MKRSKKLLSLLLVLVLILGATWAVTRLNPGDQEEEEESTAIFTLDADSVTALSWDYSEPVSFEKDGDAWVYTEDEVFPLDSTYIDTILDTLSEITSSKTIESVEDWDQYTLEAPICAISVSAGDTTYDLKIGEETAMGDERYLSIGDGNAYLVDSGILDAFSYGLYDLLAYEIIPDMSAADSLELVSDAQEYRIEYLEDSGLSYSDDYVWFLDGKALDNELTAALLENITSLTWGECVNYNASDLSQYGLDSPAATVTVGYTNAEDQACSFVLEIGAETDDSRYARIAGSNMVYTIDSDVADTLMYTTYYELQPDEVLLMDWETVTGIDISLDSVTYQITRSTKTITDDEGNESEETVWLLGGEEIDAASIMDALDDLESSGYATGLTPERAEEIRFLIHRDHEAFPEVELAFYQYDSSSCMTTLNGTATVFTQRDAVVSLVETVNALVL